MFKTVCIVAALLVVTTGQQITRTVTTNTNSQQGGLEGLQGGRTITLEELQRLGFNIQGLQGGSQNIRTVNTVSGGSQGTSLASLQGLQGLNGGSNGQTISLSSLQGLQGGGQNNVRLIQIPVQNQQSQGFSLTSGGSQGINVAVGGGGGSRTVTTTTRSQQEGGRANINFQAQVRVDGLILQFSVRRRSGAQSRALLVRVHFRDG